MSMPAQPSRYIYIYILLMEKKRVHLDAFACCHVANHVALAQYAMPGKNAQFYTRARLTSIYVLILARRNPLKSFKTCLGPWQDRGTNREHLEIKREGRLERGRERKRETLFTLRYIERQVYTRRTTYPFHDGTASSMR